MEKKEFMDKMENLSKPDIVSESFQKKLKITLLNTQKSAVFGVFLVIIPFLFAFGAIFKYQLGLDFKIFTWMFDTIAAIDPNSDSSVLSWIIRSVLLGGPLLAVFINLLAILHFHYDKTAKEILITLKLKWQNITIILFCSSVFMIFFIYLLVENIGHM